MTPGENDNTTTTCATISGSGRSAIAVIAIRGAAAADIVCQCFQPATKGPFSLQEIRYGRWQGPSGQDLASESVVVTRLAEDRFEIHCHGGRAAVDRIIDDLSAAGAQPIPAEAWSRSADHLLIHEATQVLTRCLTARTAAIAMDQVRGAMVDWASGLLGVLESGELERDPTPVETARSGAEEILAWAGFTSRLAEPFRVVLVGRPNVGKSSLMNAIVGYDRSITIDAAGTTRDVLHAETIIDGLPIRLSDTAGIHSSGQAIEKQGIQRAQNAAQQADLVIVVRQLDQAAEPLESTLDHSPERVIRVVNKVDLAAGGQTCQPGELATCALTGQGLAALMAAISEKLGQWPPPGAPAAINDRQTLLLREIAAAGDKDLVSAKLRELLGVNL